MEKVRLGDMLLKAGIIHEFQLNSALSFQRQLGGRLGASLIRLGYLDEPTLLNFLAEQLGLIRVDLDSVAIPDEVIKLVPVATALELSIVPYALKEASGSRELFVAMSDPTNLAAIDEIKFSSGCQIRAAVAAEDSVIRAIKRYYGIDVPAKNRAAQAKPAAAERPAAKTAAPTMTTEDKLKELVKILVEKKLLDKKDLERFKP